MSRIYSFVVILAAALLAGGLVTYARGSSIYEYNFDRCTSVGSLLSTSASRAGRVGSTIRAGATPTTMSAAVASPMGGKLRRETRSTPVQRSAGRCGPTAAVDLHPC